MPNNTDCQQAPGCAEEVNLLVVAAYYGAYRNGFIPRERLAEVEARAAQACAYMSSFKDYPKYRTDLDTVTKNANRLCDHPPW